MPNVTLSISEPLKHDMEQLPEVNWSKLIRGLLSERVKRLLTLKKLDKMFENSELTDEVALKLGRKVNKAVWERHKKEGW